MGLRRVVLTTLLLAMPVLSLLATASVEVNANPYVFDIDDTNLTGGAGTGFDDWYESAASAKTVSVLFPSGNWRVDVSRSDIAWDSDLQVYVRRTGGSVTGGSNYQQITTTATTFFSGTGWAFVPVQYRISGNFIALGVSPGLYRTVVTYTLYDDL